MLIKWSYHRIYISVQLLMLQTCNNIAISMCVMEVLWKQRKKEKKVGLLIYTWLVIICQTSVAWKKKNVWHDYGANAFSFWAVDEYYVLIGL